MSKLLTKLSIMGLNNKVVQFKRLNYVVDIDSLYENHTKEVQDILIKDRDTTKFIEAITEQLYRTEKNPLKIVVGIQYAYNIFGIGKRGYSVDTEHIKKLVLEVQCEDNSKKKECCKVLDLIINNEYILVGKLNEDENQSYQVMVELLKGSFKYFDVDVNEIEDILRLIESKDSLRVIGDKT